MLLHRPRECCDDARACYAVNGAHAALVVNALLGYGVFQALILLPAAELAPALFVLANLVIAGIAIGTIRLIFQRKLLSAVVTAR